MNKDAFDLLIGDLHDLEKMLDRKIPEILMSDVEREFVLPRYSDPDNYRIVEVQGERICVHQDFVDLAVDESL